jgi:stress response protein YsnF
MSEEEHEVTLTEQRAVTSKETVPVERVRLGTQTVTEQQQVDETVRKEQIDQVEVDGTAGRRAERAENTN